MWIPLLLSISAASVVDRVVAVVDAQVVLASDTELNQALLRFEKDPLPFWQREDAMVEAALIRAAAGDLALYQPANIDIDQKLRAFEAHDPAGWRRFRIRWKNKTELASLIRHRLIVEAWLGRNIPSSPKDAQAFHDETNRLLKGLERRIRVRRVAPI